MVKDFFVIAFLSIFIINFLFAFLIIFFEVKNPPSSWSWLMATAFLPFGIFIYLIFGFEGRKYKAFKKKAREDERLYSFFYEKRSAVIYKQLSFIKAMEKLTEKCHYFDRLAMLNIIGGSSPLSSLYALKIYSNGRDKFSALFKAIENAKETIFLEYYIIREDSLGQAIKTLLIKKANEGVKIFLLYDGMGNFFNSKAFLSFEGIENIWVSVFIPPRFIRLNYRCHRKICIIDNRLAFIGGFNIGIEYMGKVKKFGLWRDCHISFEGNAVTELALRFIADFNFFSDIRLSPQMLKNAENKKNKSEIPIQLVSSGPDCQNNNILNCIFKLISSAKDSIYIQTPYFVPDDSILEALKTAAISGVEVKIVIPSFPDHPFVYWASLSYLGELLQCGAKCYGYDRGFLHSKLIICDSFAVSIGTANLDIRSLKLNFETTAILYDYETALKFISVFNADLKHCHKITLEDYLKRPFLVKVKESFSRLISPML